MLEGKKIVVTGAGRGIGRAIAVACARAGAIVGINCRSPQESLEALCEEYPEHLFLLSFDVRDRPAIEKGVAEFRERAGTIDGWVNNAGVNHPGLLATATADTIREQIDVNLVGPILCIQAILPVMLEQHKGVIVNISSVAAVKPTRGQAVYAASKGGVESLTKALALEYARKRIRVHCIRPGPIDTRMIENTKVLAEQEVLARVPLGRLGKPEEVADLAVFLLSERSSFMTGSIHTIDGGYLES
jgi:3-oxoacyl-[acyl-carrier protein] reductase